MFRKALSLSLFVSLVLSGVFLSPVYKAEGDTEFYEDQPYLHYELHINEFDWKNRDSEDNSTSEFEGSVYMRREYSAQESEKFRDLLIKSYKISVLDEEYRSNVNSVLTAIAQGTTDADKAIEDISNLTKTYDGKAKMFLDYEVSTDELVTLDMITWVRDNFEIGSMVDGVPQSKMTTRLDNVNKTLMNDGDNSQKLSVIEHEMLRDHYERDVAIDGGPILKIDGVQAVWSDWEFESVGPTSHLIGGISAQKDNRLWIGQWMHLSFPNTTHTPDNHTITFAWPDEDFTGKETSFHIGLSYGEVFTNITMNNNDVNKDNFESDWFSFYSDNGTVGSFSAIFEPGYPDYETYSWHEAVDYASTLTYNGINGHLATITTQEEADLIYSLLDGNSYWLGGFHNMDNPDYSEPSNGWEWITGEPFSQEFWADGEPNEAGPEDCLEAWGFDKVLNDNRCHLGWMGLVVEYEIKNGSNHYEAYIPMWNWDMENETDVFSMVMAMPLTDEERNEILKEEGDPDADDDGIVDAFDEDDDNDGINDDNDMDDDNDGIDDDNDRCSGTKSGESVDEDGCSASQIIGELSDEEGGLPGFSFIVSIIAVLGLAILRKSRL